MFFPHTKNKDMQYSETIKKIEALIGRYKFEKALESIKKLTEEQGETTELLNFKGKIYTRQQQYGDALNTYNRVLGIDPQNKIAKYSIKMINDILKISRTFYFENPYTDDDLYD